MIMIVTIMVMNRRGREGNKKQEQDVHNVTAHHTQTNVQPVSPSRCPQADFSSFWIALPSLHTEHGILWYGMSLWPVWSPVLARLPPSFLCSFSLAEHEILKSPFQY